MPLYFLFISRWEQIISLKIINTLVFAIVSKYLLTPIVSNLVGLLNKDTVRKQNSHNIHTLGPICCYHCRSLFSL